MRTFIKIITATLLLCALALRVNATHNRAGEITFRQVGELTYEVTLITYTDSRSVQADREEIELFWGDSTKSTIRRFPPQLVAPNTRRNIYQATHTYPGPGSYILRFLDPNRIENIINIDNSVSVPFYVESLLIIDKKRGFNQSPVLLQPPIDVACVNKVFRHNPNAYDADGDSLVFTLIPPKRDVGKDVPGYFIPPASGSFTLDPYTGELVWDSPKQIGIFNIAILIEEYRNGKRIGYVIRDMQITVKVCDNNPPRLDAVKDTCVEAGANVNLLVNVRGTDIDKDNLLLTATGGPFLQKVSPAAMAPDPARGTNGEVNAQFQWKIDCRHIRKEPYRVVFRVVEDEPNRDPLLSDLKHMDIRVVGPAPQNLTASPFGNGINLKWEKTVCDNAIGYFIYRKADSSGWQHDYCETGVPGYTGYRLIDTITNPNLLEYYDTNNGTGLAPGIEYCYRVTALFLNEGQFQFVEGYSSNETCAKLIRDVPVMTNVSVESTDEANGRIKVIWSKPTEVDTQQTPGPYFYKLYRSEGFTGSNFQLIETFSSPTFAGLNDSIYVDSGLNTVATPYTYKVEFLHTFNGQETYIGKALNSSAVYLTIRRAHEKLELRWNEKVPWTNTEYVVYKKVGADLWDSIAMVTTPFYADTGLENGKDYCYRIKAFGTYFSQDFTDPLINYSQEVCRSPRDTIKPCPPRLEADADCDTRSTMLEWYYFTDTCSLDVDCYKIYYSPDRDSNFVLIDSITGRNSFSYEDARELLRNSLAGCYVITALDTFDNESPYSLQVCVDNCPIYELPNVFTPNNDNINDRFRPIKGYRFIESIDLHVYNRWGQEVFTTTEPEINWDGKDMESGKDLPEGTYYYICVVNELYLDGIIQRSLKGTVTILR